MMTTTLDLIEGTRRHLLTGQPEQLNKLSASITASLTDTTITFTYDLGGIQAGSIIELELEEIFVFAVSATPKQIIDCIRGYNGSTAATHASGVTATVRPKFSQHRILKAINDDLSDLSSPYNGLYQIKTVDITFNPSRMGYDLTGVTDILSIAEVRFRAPGPMRTWPRIDNYVLERNMPTSGTYGDFPSGFALVLYESAQPGFPIRVRYRAPFVALTTLAQDVLTIAGLPNSAHDIPPYGAAIILAAGREVKRNFDEAQGEPRRADEVPPGAQTQSLSGLRQLRRDRIMSEAARLRSFYSATLVGV